MEPNDVWPQPGPPRRASTLPVHFEEPPFSTSRHDLSYTESPVRTHRRRVEEIGSARSQRSKLHRRHTASTFRGIQEDEEDEDDVPVVEVITSKPPRRHGRRRQKRRTSVVSEADSSSDDSVTNPISPRSEYIIRRRYEPDSGSLSDGSGSEVYPFTVSLQ